MENQNESYLQHHGVKGQKWGVRKEDPESNKNKNSTNSQEYDDLIKYEKERIKLERKEERRQNREKNKKVFYGVALTAAGIAAVVTLIRRFSNKPAHQVIAENKSTIAAGKQYTTGYKNVPVGLMQSSRYNRVRNYMGKGASYNISTSAVSSMRRSGKMFKGMTMWR